jgi:hypothetical protein
MRPSSRRLDAEPWCVAPSALSGLAQLVSIAIAASIGPAPASAQPTEPARAQLVWERAAGAETCMDAELLRARVAARLGGDAFDPVAATVIEGRISPREERGFEVRFVMRVEGRVVGQRTIVGARRSCAQLDDSIVVVLALLIEVARENIELFVPEEETGTGSGTGAGAGTGSGTGAGAGAGTEAETEAEAGTGTGAETETETEAEAESEGAPVDVRGGIRIDGLVTFLALPGVAAAGRVVGLVGPRGPFSVELHAGHSLEAVAPLEGGSLIASLRWAGIAACLDATLVPDLTLGGCARIEIGAMLGRGDGFPQESSGDLVWVTPGLGARAAWHFASPLFVGILIEAGVPAAGEEFVYTPGGAVRVAHQPGPVVVSAGASLGLEWR